MDISHVFFYWDARYGPEPLSHGVGDPDFTRSTVAYRKDHRRIWRKVPSDTPRFTWIPPGLQDFPRVAAHLEPARTLYPQGNTSASVGWSGGTAVNDAAALITSGLGPLVPSGVVRKGDNSAGGSDLVILAPNHIPLTGTWQASGYVRKEGERFYTRRTLTVTGSNRVEFRVPPGEVWYCILPQLEQGDPTSPWPMPDGSSPTSRAADTLSWVCYIPPGQDFYLLHEFADEEGGIYSLGVYFGDLGFCSILRKPDGTTIEEPEEGLPPFKITQSGGYTVLMAAGSANYYPITLKLLHPDGFGTHETVEGFLTEAEVFRLGPGGFVLPEESNGT